MRACPVCLLRRRQAAKAHDCPLTSQPLAAEPSQSLQPDRHLSSQVPLLQVVTAFAALLHWLPHVPQLLVLVSRLTCMQERRAGALGNQLLQSLRPEHPGACIRHWGRPSTDLAAVVGGAIAVAPATHTLRQT